MIYVYGDTPLRADSGMTWQQWAALTTSIWRIPALVDLSDHPAQMPVSLARRLVMLYTPKDGTVIDQFMGSGTTGVAAIEQGRKFIGTEIDPTHFDRACERIESAHRTPKLFDALRGAKQLRIDEAA